MAMTTPTTELAGVLVKCRERLTARLFRVQWLSMHGGVGGVQVWGGGYKFPIRGERPDCCSVGVTPLCMGAEAVAVAVIQPLSIPPGGARRCYDVLCLWWQACPLPPEAPARAAEAGQVHRWPPEKLCP